MNTDILHLRMSSTLWFKVIPHELTQQTQACMLYAASTSYMTVFLWSPVYIQKKVRWGSVTSPCALAMSWVSFTLTIYCPDKQYCLNYIKLAIYCPVRQFQWRSVFNYLLYLDHQGQFTHDFLEGYIVLWIM